LQNLGGFLTKVTISGGVIDYLFNEEMNDLIMFMPRKIYLLSFFNIDEESL